ncbi:MAG: hypothetical protein WC730_03485, partial [Patescibacteria group bacterium]
MVLALCVTFMGASAGALAVMNGEVITAVFLLAGGFLGNFVFIYLLFATSALNVRCDLYPKKWTRKCPLFDSVKLLPYEQKNIYEGTD